ncbi:hypothetical protein VTK26DRAFT_1474 [Humicola hyalothermophila]
MGSLSCNRSLRLLAIQSHQEQKISVDPQISLSLFGRGSGGDPNRRDENSSKRDPLRAWTPRPYFFPGLEARGGLQFSIHKPTTISHSRQTDCNSILARHTLTRAIQVLFRELIGTAPRSRAEDRPHSMSTLLSGENERAFDVTLATVRTSYHSDHTHGQARIPTPIVSPSEPSLGFLVNHRPSIPIPQCLADDKPTAAEYRSTCPGCTRRPYTQSTRTPSSAGV